MKAILLFLAIVAFSLLVSCTNGGNSSNHQNRPAGSGGRGMSPGMSAETGVTR